MSDALRLACACQGWGSGPMVNDNTPRPMSDGKTERDYLMMIYESARERRLKAQSRYPQPNYIGLKVAEEAGEVIKEAVHYAEGRSTWDRVEDEVIDTIAMLTRLLIEGDQRNGIIPPHLQSSPHPPKPKGAK